MARTRTRTGNNINSDDLEAVADALLKMHGASRISNEYPAYIEKNLAARQRRRGEVSIEEAYIESSAEITQVSNIVLEIGWCEVRSGAALVGLSARQIEFLELARTMSFAEVADYTGWSRRTVARELKAAALRISSINGFGVWTVLAEVFRLPISNVKWMLRPIEHD